MREKEGGKRGWNHLHSSLDHINRGVAEHAGSTGSDSTDRSPESTNVLGVVIILKPVLHILIDKEPDGLVGSLFENCR